MGIIKTENQRTMVSLITSLIAMGLSILISFILSPYIVANFGEEANGFTQLASNFVNYATLLTIALNSMAGRFITVNYYQQDYKKCEKFYSSVIVGNFFIFLILIVPAVFFIFRLEQIIRIATANPFHIKLLFSFVFLNFFASQVNSVFGIAFYVKNKQYLQNTITVFRSLFNAGGLLLVFSVFVPAVYFVSLVGFVLSLLTIPCYFLIKKRIMPEINFSLRSFDWKATGTLLTSGIWNTLNQCGNLLMTGFDLLLSNLLIGPVPMGVLSVAKTIPNCIIQLGATVNTSFSPNLTIAYAGGDRQRIVASLRYSMKCSSLLMSVPIMALCVFGQPFFLLWMPSLNALELSVLSILTCMSFIPFAGPQTLYNVYTTTNKLKLNSITVIVGGIINVLIVLLLLKFTDLGLYAVAGVSSIISIIRNLVITVPYTARLLGLRWYEFYKDVAISIFCCLCSGAICFIISRIIPTDRWLYLILAVAVSCLLSILIIFLILLNKEEKQKLIQKLKVKKKDG